jgi:hypothetical protein
MIGITDNDDTVIAWNSTASDVIYGGQKLQTINSATVAVEADYFIARNITFMVNMLSCILHFILRSNYYRSKGERERGRTIITRDEQWIHLIFIHFIKSAMKTHNWFLNQCHSVYKYGLIN